MEKIRFQTPETENMISRAAIVTVHAVGELAGRELAPGYGVEELPIAIVGIVTTGALDHASDGRDLLIDAKLFLYDHGPLREHRAIGGDDSGCGRIGVKEDGPIVMRSRPSFFLGDHFFTGSHARKKDLRREETWLGRKEREVFIKRRRGIFGNDKRLGGPKRRGSQQENNEMGLHLSEDSGNEERFVAARLARIAVSGAGQHQLS